MKRNLPRVAYVFCSALALSHIAFYFAYGSDGFLMYLVDFPASILAVLPANALGLRRSYGSFLLFVVGTAWWFFIGILISKVVWFFHSKKRIS